MEHPCLTSQAQVLVVLGVLPQVLGEGSWGGRDGSQRAGVGSRVQNGSDRMIQLLENCGCG